MSDVIITGGVLKDKERNVIIENICHVFSCEKDEIEELLPVQAGMTNIVMSFRYNGGKYIYRHPGLGSDALVDRSRETIMQYVVGNAGIDTTLVAMDVDDGWRIGRYIEHFDFDYHNLNHMVRAIMLLRELHSVSCKIRCNFDVIKKAEGIKKQIPLEEYGRFDKFNEIRERIYKLDNLTKNDGIRKCNIHGDARDVNFLINKENIYLIDWEYGGYGDPGFDIGSYICGGQHSQDDVDRILFTYFGHKPNEIQKKHFYAYIAITGWFYLHWTMLKESKGQMVGENKELWYRYAYEYSKIAIEMYEEE